MNIVIYGSQYGTAKRYAEELSNRLGFELKSYEEVADVNLYDTIIYVGALYAGGVLGMKKTFKGMKDSNGHTIVIACSKEKEISKSQFERKINDWIDSSSFKK